MSQQPTWKFVANLGDRSPIEYGGLFVYVDTTNVYPPECVQLEAPNDDDGTWSEYRFVLENLTAESITGEWFYDSLDDIARSIDSSKDELVADFLSPDPTKRAFAWSAIGEYHGFINLDHYPNEYNRTAGRQELEQRYWLESGKAHPPAGARFQCVRNVRDHFTASYPQCIPEFPVLARCVGLLVMSFHTPGDYRPSFEANIALGEI